MPELPDLTVYLEALRRRIVGQRLDHLSIRGPFLLRSVTPPDPDAAEFAGRSVSGVQRLGKRIVIGFEGEVFAVIHLMIAGRLRWRDGAARPTGRIDLAAFVFESGTLLLTEAGTKKRASLHLLAGREALARHDPGGLDVFTTDAATFAAVLRRESHTLKRVLTDPRLLSGIGNAYSDEILHAARLSPLKLTSALTAEETDRLLEAARSTLQRWTGRLLDEFGLTGESRGRFPGPGEITAFRADFAVHGRFGQACPVCGAPVQRIIHAESETNYCAKCQTGGRVLADRSMSRLLKDDWPRDIDEWSLGRLA